MDNPTREEALRRLASLSRQERRTLQLVCQGNDYLSITEILFLSMSSVKQYMGRVYIKLGLDILDARAERMKVIYQVYCPLLHETEEGLAPRGAIAPASVPEEQASEPPLTVPPKVRDMVDEDGYAITRVAPAALKPPPSPPRRRTGIRGLVLGVVLGACLSAIAVFLFLRSDAEMTPPAAEVPTEAEISTAITLLPTNTGIPATEMPSATLPPTIEVSPTLKPTSTQKAFYEEEESVNLRDEVYIYLTPSFMSAGSVRCDKPDPGFGVYLQLNNDSSGDYLLRYQASDFRAVDDLGNEYPVFRVGFHNCRETPGPIEDIIHTYSDNLFVMAFRGQIAFDAQYLLITVEFSGAGPFVFRKQL